MLRLRTLTKAIPKAASWLPPPPTKQQVNASLFTVQSRSMTVEANDDVLLLQERPSPGVIWLTINRPRKRNALSSALLSELHDVLVHVRQDKTARVVVIAAKGPVFSSGHDLKEIASLDEKGQRSVFTRCSEVMGMVQEGMPQVTIACVQGLATAAGCQLVAACDLATASSRARFATPGVDIGLFCSTPAVSIGRAVQRKHAMRMLVTGDPVDAATACNWGLVSDVVDDAADSNEQRDEGTGELWRATLALAVGIASKPAATISHGKQVFASQLRLPLTEAYGITTDAMCNGLQSADAKEGVGAFLAKRQPTWPSNID